MPDWVIQWWVTAVFGGVVGYLGAAVKGLKVKQKSQQIEHNAIKDGMKAILFAQIRLIYKDCESKHFASIDDIQDMEMVYNPYRDLGGNGTGETMYKRVKNMPTEEIKEG